MTKLEFVLSGKGSKKERCIYAAFNCDPENGEQIAKYYNRCYDDFPFPHVCIDIIKIEYKGRINRLSGNFLFELICRMIQTHTDAYYYENEIWEEINFFMNN